MSYDGHMVNNNNFQDIPGLLYQSGEVWVHQCLQCQCVDGETDCWVPECHASSCPALLCGGQANKTRACTDCSLQVRILLSY